MFKRHGVVAATAWATLIITIFAFGIGVLPAGSAPAQNEACRAAARRIGDALILPAWCTAGLEHADRKARLARLARLQGMGDGPHFYEYVVAKDDLRTLLPQFPTDIPVLRVVFDDQVFFDFDKSEVREEAGPILDLISESMRREPPDVALFIAGHTDAIGSDAYNTDLAMRRADAVAHALLDRGVGLSSVFRVSFGETMPIDDNQSDVGRQHNRRVEFLLAARPEAAALWLAKQAGATCFEGDREANQRCRQAISVAEEIKRGTPRLLPVQVTAAIGLRAPRPRARLRSEDHSARIQAEGVQIAQPPTRTFTIDLGRRAVSIGLPRR